MSARTRLNKRSKRAAYAIAQQHSQPGWSAIRAAREVVAARDDALRWMADREQWRRGFGANNARAVQEFLRIYSGDREISGWAQFGLQRAYFENPLPDKFDPKAAAEGLTEHVYELHRDLFTLVEPFIVSPQMHQTVQAAANTVEVSDLATLRRDDIAFEHGLLWLPEEQSIHDSELLAKAISWTVRYLLDFPCLVVTAWEYRPADDGASVLGELWSTMMPLAGEHNEQADFFTRVGSIDIAAYMFAFLRLSTQRIVITPRLRDQERYPGTPKPYEQVRVTRLRVLRTAADIDAVLRPVDWQHRWMVKMHKVKQWYPSEGVHRVLFRGPFIKGPEDKPLLTGEKVNALVR